MPLQNRVSPFGDLYASSARGLFMGNRGGRFHTDAKTLTARRWASRQWICCVLDFKGRRRDVWGRFYTEVFFLDEPTALAAGHRPCFECRRSDAETFAETWREARKRGRRPSAGEMDAVLHSERLAGSRQTPAPAQSRRTARRRIRRAGAGSLRGPRRCAAALDAGRLRCRQAAAARHRCRCAHPAGDPCGSVRRLPTALASERDRLALPSPLRCEALSHPRDRSHAVATIAAMIAWLATMVATQPVQPAASQTKPTRKAPALPPI